MQIARATHTGTLPPVWGQTEVADAARQRAREGVADPSAAHRAGDTAQGWAASFRVTGAASHDRTTRFCTLMARKQGRLSPATAGALRNTVVVLVRGYLAEAYRACGRGYLDAQKACCERLGARVLVGRVSGCRTAAVNSAELFAQIAKETGPQDRVLLMAHSHGTLAALDILCNPAYAAVQERVVGFVAINGVFGGTPVADLWGKAGCLKGADWLLDRSLHAVGGERGVLKEMGTRCRQEYLRARRSDIARVLRRVPVLCLATHFRWPSTPWDLPGIAMQPYRVFMQRRGYLNDGCVPVSSQILPGATHVIVDNMHHAQTIDSLGGGVDLQDMTESLLAMVLEPRAARHPRIDVAPVRARL